MKKLIYLEDAIEAIKDADVLVSYDTGTDTDDACELAIRATKGSVIESVKVLPSAQPEQVRTQMSSADCISRQAAIDATWEEPTYTNPINVLTEIRDRIKALPSAEPNIKTLTPKEFVGEISPVSLYSANEWHSVTVWLYKMGYVICRKES